MTWGPSLSSLVEDSFGIRNAEDSLDSDSLFQVELSSERISLDSQASFSEFQKFRRFGTAKPPLLLGSSVDNYFFLGIAFPDEVVDDPL